MKAIVIGGSIGGLFAALFLRRNGCDVDVYERAELELAGRGAGIATHPQILQALDALGLRANDFGLVTTVRRAFDIDGKVVAEREYRQIMTSWDRLYALLYAAFPAQHYHRGKELVSVDGDGASVVAHFADGSRVGADMLVAADGYRSTVRAQFLPGAGIAYAGYVAWRALAPEQRFSPALVRALFDGMTFCLPPGEQILGYPVEGTLNDPQGKQRYYNIVWYRPTDEGALAHLLTDDAGHTHDISIPPPRIAPAIVAEMRAAAESKLAPQFREAMRLADRPFLQPIYDLEVPSMAFGRVAIVGDAAFVARPHVGAGVAKAAQDAQALGDALAADSDVIRALTTFETTRVPIGCRIVARARQLGAYMQARRHTEEEHAMAKRYRDPVAVLADTATLSFL